MQQWEYINVSISRTVTKEPGLFRGGAEYAWVAHLPDGKNIEGVDNVLNAYGERGWELVNIVPEDWGPTGGTLKLMAFFKREAVPQK